MKSYGVRMPETVDSLLLDLMDDGWLIPDFVEGRCSLYYLHNSSKDLADMYPTVLMHAAKERLNNNEVVIRKSCPDREDELIYIKQFNYAALVWELEIMEAV